MKRIDWIVKGCKGVVKNSYEYSERKIKRIIEDAIDETNEDIIESERKAVTTIEEIKDCIDDKAQIVSKINAYLDIKADIDAMNSAKKYLKELQNILQEEIEVEDTNDKDA